MKVGITERGDAALDYSWVPALDNREVDGAILITKHITNKFINEVLDRSNVIVHCTCTGHGATMMEPNVPNYQEQLNQLKKLIESGFPVERCVLRVDPIIPTVEGLRLADAVLSWALQNDILPKCRVRISVLDEYKHVKSRFTQAGLLEVYKDRKYPSSRDLSRVRELLHQYRPIKFEACAEPYLLCDNLIHNGCVSDTDLNLMGVSAEGTMFLNPQDRVGCRCLSCKTELLQNKCRCGHECLYCYWRDK